MITIEIKLVLRAEQYPVFNQASRIDPDIIPFFICRNKKIITLPLITCQSLIRQNPDIILLVLCDLINYVMREGRIRIIRLMNVFF